MIGIEIYREKFCACLNMEFKFLSSHSGRLEILNFETAFFVHTDNKKRLNFKIETFPA